VEKYFRQSVCGEAVRTSHKNVKFFRLTDENVPWRRILMIAKNFNFNLTLQSFYELLRSSTWKKPKMEADLHSAKLSL
jgi:hypothetical protein